MTNTESWGGYPEIPPEIISMPELIKRLSDAPWIRTSLDPRYNIDRIAHGNNGYFGRALVTNKVVIRNLFKRIASQSLVSPGVYLRNMIKLEPEVYLDAVNFLRENTKMSPFVFVHAVYIALPDDIEDLFDKVTKIIDSKREEGILIPGTQITVFSEERKLEIFKRYGLRAHKVYKLGYKYFDSNDDFSYSKSCLINLLLKRYSVGRKPIADGSIKKFFSESTTVQRLTAFCRRYKINLTLLNILGKPLYKHKHLRPDKSALVAIVFQGHIYPYTKKDGKKIDMTVDRESDLIYDTKGKHALLDGKEEKDSMKMMFKFMSGLPPNFSYKAEEDIFPRALMFRKEYDPMIEEKPLFGIDMKKCYYTTFLQSKDSKVGFFCIDDVVQAFKGDLIIDYFIYYLSDKRSSRLMKLGITTNVMHGFMVKLLIKNRVINKKDIKFFKKASYYVTVDELIKIFSRESGVDDIEDIDGVGDPFRILNGIMGRRFSTRNCIEISSEIRDDIELTVRSDEVSVTLDVDEDDDLPYKANIVTKQYYKYINLRNVYDFIVDKASYFVLKEYFRIKTSIPGINLYKMQTDSLVFDKPFEVPENWKEETPRIISVMTKSFIYQDGSVVRKNTLDEIKGAGKNVKCFWGPPGVGKTFKVKKNMKYDYSLALTNVACRNMDTEAIKASTLYKFFKMSKRDFQWFRFYQKSFWIDELSQVNLYFMNYIFLLAMRNQVILTGDYDQLGPVKESVQRWDSPFFSLFLEKSKTLLKQYRTKSKTLLKLIEYVRLRDIPKIESIIERCSTIVYPEILFHLCYTNNMRNFINRVILENLGFVFNPEKISVGTRVSPNQKFGKFMKNIVYEYQGSGNMKVITGSFAGSIYKIDRKLIYDRFRLAFCMTTHSIQGMTIDFQYCIHEYKKMMKGDWRILYVAVSRAKDIDMLFFADDPKYDPRVDYTLDSDKTTSIDSFSDILISAK